MKLDENNYVDLAEEAILKLRGMVNKQGRPIPMVTTSKIRNLLAMTAEIYNEAVNSKSERLSADIIGQINYLRIRCVYEAGRDAGVKNLVETAGILEHIGGIQGSRKKYILFSKYMEALVAYRKYYGGRDE
jgi:CRISPR-associated protein Csm2